MKTAGEILKTQRLKKNLTLEKASFLTKIQPIFLQALEENDLAKLPRPPFVFGLLKNYSRFLGLKEEDISAIFRRQYNIAKKNLFIPPQPLKNDFFHFTPGTLAAALVFLSIAAFLFYLVIQYMRFANAPVLIVSQPHDQEVISQTFVNVVGKTDPTATVSINGQLVVVNDQGLFDATVNLSNGVNILTVVASNKQNKQTSIMRSVTVKNGG